MGPGKEEIRVLLIRKRRSGAESREREKRGEGDDEGEGPEKPPTRELDDATIYESAIRATTTVPRETPYYYESAFFKPPSARTDNQLATQSFCWNFLGAPALSYDV